MDYISMVWRHNSSHTENSPLVYAELVRHCETKKHEFATAPYQVYSKQSWILTFLLNRWN